MNGKPIQLMREDFAHALAQLVDKTPLPAFVKIDTLNNMVAGLSAVAQQEYEQAKAYWDEQEKKEGKKNEIGSNKQDKISEKSDDISEDVDTIQGQN